MNTNNIYPRYCYPYDSEYRQAIQQNEQKVSVNTRPQQPITDADIDMSVRKIKEAVKKQIRLEKRTAQYRKRTITDAEVSKSVKKIKEAVKEQSIKEKKLEKAAIACSSSATPENTENTIINSDALFSIETNRIPKHIKEKLEIVYQDCNYFNHQQHDQLAKDLNLPIKKVFIWFQNRRAKDRRENPEKFEAAKKLAQANKYLQQQEEQNNDCNDKNVKSVADANNDENVSDKKVKRRAKIVYKPNCQRLRATSPKPFKERDNYSPHIKRRNLVRYNDERDLPYWPSFEWNNIDTIPFNESDSEEEPAMDHTDDDYSVNQTYTDDEADQAYAGFNMFH